MCTLLWLFRSLYNILMKHMNLLYMVMLQNSLFVSVFPTHQSFKMVATLGITMRAMSYKRRKASLLSSQPTKAAR